MLSLYPASPPSTLCDIPDGVEGIRATLKHMAHFVRDYKTDSGINTLSRQIVCQTPGSANNKDYATFVRLLHYFVRDRIRYVMDIEGVEMLQTPIRTLQIGTGDCDDKATLLACLLSSIGFKNRFRALAFDDGPFTHVLGEVQLGRGWLPLETIVDGVEPGWFPDNPAPTHFYVWHV